MIKAHPLTLKEFNCICINRRKRCLSKPVTQSSASNGGMADLLVEGNHSPYFGKLIMGRSWEVDIGVKFYLTVVTITAHADDCWRDVNMFSITVRKFIVCLRYVFCMMVKRLHTLVRMGKGKCLHK